MYESVFTKLEEAFLRHYQLTPIMGAELECYIALTGDVDAWWRPLHDGWKQAGISLLRIEKERGDGQFEWVLGLQSPSKLAQHLQRMKADVIQHAHATNVSCSFAAKPFADQPASGLHLHLHLQTQEGANIFFKQEEGMSEALDFTIGGVLAFMQEALPYYCPDAQDIVRFDDEDHVPRANSWGVNNRYCALRIPMTQTPYDKWVELRVPSSQAEPGAAIAAYLASCLLGLLHRMPAPAQEFGKPVAQFMASVNAQTVDASLQQEFHSWMGGAHPQHKAG